MIKIECRKLYELILAASELDFDGTINRGRQYDTLVIINVFTKQVHPAR
jgi:hypothetical protein